jgi:hypothetical protein
LLAIDLDQFHDRLFDGRIALRATSSEKTDASS